MDVQEGPECPRCTIIATKLVPLKNGSPYKVCRSCKRRHAKGLPIQKVRRDISAAMKLAQYP